MGRLLETKKDLYYINKSKNSMSGKTTCVKLKKSSTFGESTSKQEPKCITCDKLRHLALANKCYNRLFKKLKIHGNKLLSESNNLRNQILNLRNDGRPHTRSKKRKSFIGRPPKFKQFQVKKSDIRCSMEFITLTIRELNDQFFDS